MTYSHMGNATLPSAQVCFTSEFGMGSGGSRPLWSSGKTVDHWGTRWNVMLISFELTLCVIRNCLGCYIVKPHEQLVPVSSTPRSAYTPGLSTSWS